MNKYKQKLITRKRQLEKELAEIKAILSPDNLRNIFQKEKEYICDKYGIGDFELFSKSHKKIFVKARKELAFNLKTKYDYPYNYIAGLFGLTHANIIYYVKSYQYYLLKQKQNEQRNKE